MTTGRRGVSDGDRAILAPKSVLSTMPSDVFVARRVGSSVFCSVEGRLVCLHIKTDHTFLITVTQEPLILHLGTYRFKSLAGGRGEGASVAAYAKAFIEAFEHTSLVGDEQQQRAQLDVRSGASADQEDDSIGVRLLLAEDHAEKFTQEGSMARSPRQRDERGDELGNAATLARRSSLLSMHREKMDLEMKQLGSSLPGSPRGAVGDDGPSSPQLRSPLKWNQAQREDSISSPKNTLQLRSDEELRSEAASHQTVGIVVRFSVFGTPHSVVLHLKASPTDPNIREHIIWGVCMDLYRSVAHYRGEAQRLQGHMFRHQMERAAHAKQVTTHDALVAAASEKQDAHATSLPRPMGSASSDGRGVHRPASGSTASRRLFSEHPSRVNGSESGTPRMSEIRPAVSSRMPPNLRPPVPEGSKQPDESPILLGSGTADSSGAKATTARVGSGPRGASTWSYSARSAYLDSTKSAPGRPPETTSPRTRPTSASSDFNLRVGYVRDVQLRGMVKRGDAAAGGADGGTSDQYLLLHPAAPPSATAIRGTFSGRTVQSVHTVQLSL